MLDGIEGIMNLATASGEELAVFIGIFTGDWDKAWNGIKETFKDIWDEIKNNISDVLNTIKALIALIW